LIVVYNKIIVPDIRDKVFIEWFIPSGSMLINPNLDTTTRKKIAKNWELIFDKIEYRLDRFFGYKEKINIWEYHFTYLIRATHSWIFNIKPTKIWEFYNAEIFGRTAWEEFVVE
jgi:uncharacterized protein YfaS (alpha-2-macroglobulin family)